MSKSTDSGAISGVCTYTCSDDSSCTQTHKLPSNYTCNLTSYICGVKSCNTDADCSAGEICNDAKQCIAGPTSCTTKSPMTDCGNSYYCNVTNTATGTGTCAKEGSIGDKCTSASQCQSNVCASNNQCVQCVSDNQCGSDQSCSNNKCVAQTNTCSSGADCTDSSKPYCDITTGVCEASPSCSSDNQCSGNSVCSGGLCYNGNNGDSCTSNTQCQSNLCQSGECVTTSCSTQGGIVCSSGLCGSNEILSSSARDIGCCIPGNGFTGNLACNGTAQYNPQLGISTKEITTCIGTTGEANVTVVDLNGNAISQAQATLLGLAGPSFTEKDYQCASVDTGSDSGNVPGYGIAALLLSLILLTIYYLFEKRGKSKNKKLKKHWLVH